MGGIDLEKKYFNQVVWFSFEFTQKYIKQIAKLVFFLLHFLKN